MSDQCDVRDCGRQATHVGTYKGIIAPYCNHHTEPSFWGRPIAGPDRTCEVPGCPKAATVPHGAYDHCPEHAEAMAEMVARTAAIMARM